MFKVAYHNCYAHSLPEGHRFPMEKYELIPEQLLYEGTIEESQLFSPKKAQEWIPALAHKKSYLEKLKNLTLSKKEERKVGFPQSAKLYNRELIITQGTIDNIDFSFRDGIAFNVAGGTHHAGKDFAEGFCLINDQSVAALYAIHKAKAKKVLIVDLDVHQGNGTADILGQHPDIYTFSMHGAKNYPMHKPKSHWDIPLEDGTGNEEYLSTLEKALKILNAKAKWDMVFFQSGVDVLASDKLGRLSLDINGCAQRDQMVMDLCYQNNIPLVVSMGGGYSPDIKTIVEAHCNTYRIAAKTFI